MNESLEDLYVKKSLLKHYESKSFFSKKEIKDIINKIIEFRSLQDYVTEIEVGNNTLDLNKDFNSEQPAGYYDRLNKKVGINFTKMSDDWEQSNVMVMVSIFHELEHVEQFKLCENEEELTNDELKLKKRILMLSLGYSVYASKYKDFDLNNLTKKDIDEICKINKLRVLMENLYEKMYVFLPSERMANITSYKKLLEIIEDMKLANDCVVDSIKLIYEHEKVRGFHFEEKNLISPTSYVCMKCLDELIKDEERKQKISDDILLDLKEYSKQFDIEKRMYYGLSISSDEYVNQYLKAISFYTDEKASLERSSGLTKKM